jgi:hypothetical protein
MPPKLEVRLTMRSAPRPMRLFPTFAAVLCLLPGLLLGLPLLAGTANAKSPQPGQPGGGECQVMQELYRGCHRLGQQTGSQATCQEAALELLQRAENRAASKNPQATHALAEVVCATGCEDALSGQPPATPQEFAEAFCQPAPKNQGARP